MNIAFAVFSASAVFLISIVVTWFILLNNASSLHAFETLQCTENNEVEYVDIPVSAAMSPMQLLFFVISVVASLCFCIGIGEILYKPPWTTSIVENAHAYFWSALSWFILFILPTLVTGLEESVISTMGSYPGWASAYQYPLALGARLVLRNTEYGDAPGKFASKVQDNEDRSLHRFMWRTGRVTDDYFYVANTTTWNEHCSKYNSRCHESPILGMVACAADIRFNPNDIDVNWYASLWWTLVTVYVITIPIFTSMILFQCSQSDVVRQWCSQLYVGIKACMKKYQEWNSPLRGSRVTISANGVGMRNPYTAVSSEDVDVATGEIRFTGTIYE